MTADMLRKLIVELGQRARFRQDFSAYAIRRAHSNALDNPVSTAGRQMRMSHTQTSTYLDAYISSMLDIDSQAIMLGIEKEKEPFDLIRSIMFEHD